MSLDPQTLLAQGTSIAGNAVATFLLSKEGAAAVPGLTAIAAALPKIPVGGVTPFQAGQLVAQMNAINTKAGAAGAPADLVAQIGSVIALVTNAQAQANGGDITATQALLVAAGTNVAIGINNAVQFFQGSQAPAAT